MPVCSWCCLQRTLPALPGPGGWKSLWGARRGTGLLPFGFPRLPVVFRFLGWAGGWDGAGRVMRFCPEGSPQNPSWRRHEGEKWKSQNLPGNDKPKPKPTLPPATALLVWGGSNRSVSTLSKQFVLISVVGGGGGRGLHDMLVQDGKPRLSHTPKLKKYGT